MTIAQRIIRIENQASEAVSIAEQLGLGYSLVAPARRRGGGGEVIDLSSPGPALNGSRTASSGPPRLIKWRRSKHPVLPGWPSWDGRQLVVLCPWCGRHYHGRHGHEDTCRRLLKGRDCGCGLHADLHGFRGPCTCPPGSGDGHRIAHCHGLSRSPMKEGGYVVREVRLP